MENQDSITLRISQWLRSCIDFRLQRVWMVLRSSMPWLKLVRKLDVATCGVFTSRMQGGNTELGHFLPLGDRGKVFLQHSHQSCFNCPATFNCKLQGSRSQHPFMMSKKQGTLCECMSGCNKVQLSNQDSTLVTGQRNGFMDSNSTSPAN